MESRPTPVQFTRGPLLVVLGLTALPAILIALKVPLGFVWPPPEVASADPAQLHRAVSGSIVHSLLEWTAVIIAALTAVIAYAHYRATRETVTLTLSIALAVAGTMDAFHTLAADDLVRSVAPRADFVAFTWAICRTFNSLLMLTAVAWILLASKAAPKRSALRWSWLLVAAAVAATAYAATSPTLPATYLTGGFITRPFDVVPLLAFAACGLWAYPRLHRRIRSGFTLALLLSVIPDAATQVHMAFFSVAGFDNHFIAAHVLKILAYAIPFMGLTWDSVRIHRQQDRTAHVLALTRASLEREKHHLAQRNAQLTQANDKLVELNRQLDEFAYVASHDLQEPLRKLLSFSELLRLDLPEQLPPDAETDLHYIEDSAMRMKSLVEGLLEFYRTSNRDLDRRPVDLRRLMEALRATIEVPQDAQLELKIAPAWVMGSRLMLMQAIQNLVGNAIKYRHPERSLQVSIEVVVTEALVTICVSDNGAGFEQKYADEVFRPFRRLDAVRSGSGIGLSICREVVNRHQGTIVARSRVGHGSHFTITLPRGAAVSPQHPSSLAA